MGCLCFECLAWLSVLYRRCLHLVFCSSLKSARFSLIRWRCSNIGIGQPIDVSSASLASSGPGTDFGSGSICLGEIVITEVTVFEKVWSTLEGGVNNKGVTFSKPVNLPQGFRSLGFLSLQNEGSLEGSMLVARNQGCASTPALVSPVGYTLVWSYTEVRGSSAFFWLPTPPDGYGSLGCVVTTTADVPSNDEVVCVRVDLTDSCKVSDIAWETNTPSTFKVWNLVPSEMGASSQGIPVGAFFCSADSVSNSMVCVSRLRNTSFSLSGMPSLVQLNSLIKKYGPTIYFHPDEKYFPCSVSWFFSKRALLYTKGQNAPSLIAADGSNLPEGGYDDDEYWIDLPNDGTANEVRIGQLSTAKVYIHAKPMLGAAFTDIAIWLYYAFNGSATAKLNMVNLSLGKIGEHVSDWEHVTMRVNNLTGQLSKVFFSQHSGGEWLDVAALEYGEGSNFVVYSSKSGHASYPRPGLVLQGDHGVGIRNDSAKSKYFLNSSQNFEIMSADYLGSSNAPKEPAWLQYMRKWGPKVEYDSKQELEKAIKTAPFFLRSALRSLTNRLPDEVFGEEGPTGPKQKVSWKGDEKM